MSNESRLCRSGVNASIAMLVTDGLRAYLKGEKSRAADDLLTAAEEIAAKDES